MDVMTEQPKIPYKILEAYDLLLQYRIVNINQPLDWDPDRKGWTFEFEVNVIPNQQGISSPVKLLAVIPEAFPLESVDFYPVSEDVSFFPHQSLAGKLCLPMERSAPSDSKRLVCYVKWAINWLMDAAKGTLFKAGDPYELPQFPCKKKFTVYFSEDFSTYKRWSSMVGQNGIVKCALGRSTTGLFVTTFSDSNGSVILENNFTPNNIDWDRKIVGQWFILSDICYYRHRPPLTFNEINELCTKHDLDFYNILKRAWQEKDSFIEWGLILVGFPIPKIVGGEAHEIHWQPLLFDNVRADRKKVSGSKKLKKKQKIWSALIKNGRFSFFSELPWACAANIANNRLHSRGSFTQSLCDAHIAIFGCGALGSSIAEQLIRGGIKKMVLLDYDIVEFGNLCRHTLDGRHVGLSKAESLSIKLSSINPLSIINGYKQCIPLTSKTPENVHQAVNSADVLIDCTTSESAFEWLNNYAVEQNKILISTFFDFYAKHLTLCISGKENSCAVIYRELLRLVNNNELPVSPEEYFYKPTKAEEVIEGAGCWHATFPALNNHIQMLAVSAVDLINAHFEGGEGKGLAAVIIRKPLYEAEISALPLITLWKREYP